MHLLVRMRCAWGLGGAFRGLKNQGFGVWRVAPWIMKQSCIIVKAQWIPELNSAAAAHLFSNFVGGVTRLPLFNCIHAPMLGSLEVLMYWVKEPSVVYATDMTCLGENCDRMVV